MDGDRHEIAQQNRSRRIEDVTRRKLKLGSYNSVEKIVATVGEHIE